MTRIGMLPVEQWDPELRELAGGGGTATDVELGLARIFAHTPEMAKGLFAFTGALKEHRSLSERLAEIVRLRIAFHNQCRSCMAIRYSDAVGEGVDEDLVCSLEKPAEAPDLTDAERAALRYADLMANNHLAIGDDTYDDLRRYFSEAQIVELGLWIALCIGIGRLAATWKMIEELPAEFQAEGDGPVGPWSGAPVVIRWTDGAFEHECKS